MYLCCMYVCMYVCIYLSIDLSIYLDNSIFRNLPDASSALTWTSSSGSNSARDPLLIFIIQIHTPMYIHIRTHIYVYICIYMSVVCLCVCMYVCISIDLSIYLYNSIFRNLPDASSALTWTSSSGSNSAKDPLLIFVVQIHTPMYIHTHTYMYIYVSISIYLSIYLSI